MLAILCLTAEGVSKKVYESKVVVDRVTSVYDADTFRVNIKNWPDIIGKNIPIRANGFDAPEIRGECPAEKEAAKVAKALTVKALRNAKEVTLRNVRRGNTSVLSQMCISTMFRYLTYT